GLLVVPLVVVPSELAAGSMNAGVNVPGAVRTGITCTTVLTNGGEFGTPEGIVSSRVTRTARGGPVGVVPSGPATEPSQVLLQLAPSKYSNVRFVTSSRIVSASSLERSGSTPSPSAGTHRRPRPPGPPVGPSQ